SLAARSLADNPATRIEASDRIFYTPKPLAHTGQLAFVFPGSGNHFAGMGRDLGVAWPEVFRRQDAENDCLFDQIRPDIVWNQRVEGFADHRTLILGQVAVGTLVGDLLQQFAIRPRAVIGYSLGESAGLFALRAWCGRDEMLRRLNASTLFTSDLAGRCAAARQTWKLTEREGVDWTAGVLACPAKEVRTALQGRQRVYLLIINTPRECVIGGSRGAVEALLDDLKC